jgi:ABC-type iron transport system FetAB ATPase subunit
MTCLHVENLHYQALGPFSFELQGGECLGLSGPSGAGKSLLLRALADLDAYQGTVLLNADACHQLPPTQWRRRVGLLSAESHWWADRVGAHFHTVNDTQLASLGFEPAVLEWSVHRLSSGERQRLALLRLLANRPEVLLLDEPTANLDPHNSAVVETLIQQQRELHGVAVLWVSHDAAQLARVAQRRLHLVNGRLEHMA